MNKALLILAFISLMNQLCYAQVSFAKSFQYNSQNISAIQSCKLNGKDGMLILGSINSTQTLALKSNNLGDTLWTKKLLGNNSTSVTNYFDQGYILRKEDAISFIDTNANTIWTRGFLSKCDDILSSAIVLKDSSIIMVGYSDTTCNSQLATALQKLNKFGNLIWTKYILTCVPLSIIESNDGCLFLSYKTSGTGIMKLDSLGNFLWSKSFSFLPSQAAYADLYTEALVQNNSQNIFILNNDPVSKIALLNSIGDTISTTIGRTHYFPDIFKIVPTIDKGIAGIGWAWTSAYHDLDIYTIKLDSLGNVEKEKLFGESYSDEVGRSIFQTSDGGFYILADRDSSNKRFILLLKTNSNFDVVYSVTYLQKQSDVFIFPNPTNGLFNMKLPPNDSKYLLSVFDLLGNEIFKKDITNSSNNEVDITNLPSGTYQVQLISDKNYYQQKIIKN